MGKGGIFLRELRAKFSEQPTGFVWVERDKVAGSGYPASRGQVAWVVGQGIDSILTLTETPLPNEFTQGLQVKVTHMPMTDHASPEPSALEARATFVVEEVKQGRRMLVHCLAGEGRTGCVLAAYLIRQEGLGADEAIQRLRKVKPAFVEPRQEGALAHYAASVKH